MAVKTILIGTQFDCLFQLAKCLIKTISGYGRLMANGDLFCCHLSLMGINGDYWGLGINGCQINPN